MLVKAENTIIEISANIIFGVALLFFIVYPLIKVCTPSLGFVKDQR